MKHTTLLSLIVLFSTLVMLLPPRGAIAQGVVVGARQQGEMRTQADETIWTRWHPHQYALAEDADALWIGAAGGVVRWDKTSKTHQRYTAAEGLPHQNVYAVAIDASGNRWFGGDGGLSRLDGNNSWTHFTTENSSMHSNLVDGIAVSADNTLWVSHGLPAGGVSRRDPDGSWRWYPSRAVAVVTDYARIQQTRNVNPLWTVTGAEIWVGYAVYNGSSWLDRTPEDTPSNPEVVAADSAGVVWVLHDNQFGDSSLRKWSNNTWSTVTAFLNFGGAWSVLAVGADNTVWIGGRERTFPYANYQAVYSRSPDFGSLQFLKQPGPITAILPTTTGMWAVGPGWLFQPDGALYTFADVPTFTTVTDVLVALDNTLWVHSQQLAPYSEGVLQTLDDQGTALWADDLWTRDQALGVLTAFEQTPSGDLWAAHKIHNRIEQFEPPLRRHQGAWIEYTLPISTSVVIADIFAQDDRHSWFAYAGSSSPFSGEARGVLALDDGGTPTLFSDDHWQNYPINTSGVGGAVAVDALGRLWFGDNSNLYRYDGKQWQLHTGGGICDLTPAANGVLFVQPSPCDRRHTLVFSIDANGATNETTDVDELVKDQFDLVRSAARRNQLWTVAPDGAVWYPVTTFQAPSTHTQTLQRRSATGLTTYPLPFNVEQIRRLEVDAKNHLWIVADSALWRLTPKADFSLAIQPTTWLLAPGDSRRGRVIVTGEEGFNASVTLHLSGLPNEITAQLDPSAVKAGDSVTVTLSAGAGAALGTYPATLMGVSNNITHTVPLTIAVVAAVSDNYLPLVAR